MAEYKVGDLANLISSSSQSNEAPTNDLCMKKKKNKKRSAENEEVIVENGKASTEPPEIKKKKKKKHIVKESTEEPINNTVSIIPAASNEADKGSEKKKKRKHVEEIPSPTAATDNSNDVQGEPQKKKKKKKNKENVVTTKKEDGDTVVNSISSEAPAGEGKKRNRNRKKKKLTAAEKLKKSMESANGNGKIKEKNISSQELDDKKNEKKLKKKKKRDLAKLKKAAATAKSKPDSDDIEPTVTLENKKEKKEKSKKEVKKEKIKERKNQSLPNQHPDAEERTVFIGNVHMETKRKELTQIFSKYGKVESVRIRGVAVGEQGMRKKVAHVTGQMHPSRSSVTAYVRFESKDSAIAALEANRMVLRDHHLNVDRAIHETKRELRNSVFIGNLPWEAEDEALYKHFEGCGDIESVRIIRDKQLNSGKGFGYVNFQSSDATEVALQLAGKMFMNRPLRVIRCTKKQKKEKVKDDSITKKSNMNLGFMKKDNKIKSKNNQQTPETTPKETAFSGDKTAELGKNKRIKKPRWSKDDKKKASAARLLAGDKAVVQRPKFTAKKVGGGKPTGKPIAKKFGGKPNGRFGGKPGGKPFAGKPSTGKKEHSGTGENKRITFD